MKLADKINIGIKMMWLIMGIILFSCGTVGLILQIQNIKERWEREESQQIQ